MRTKIFALFAMGVAFAFPSCVKNNTQNPENPEIKVQDLKVPANFDWVMSKAVTCTVNSTTSASVEIYQDQACTEELLATFTTSAGTGTVTSLSIPVGVAELYLKYNSAAGVQVLTQKISNNGLVFNVTDAVAANAKSLTKADTPTIDREGFLEYPANWGTVLFEDLFPSVGDYDFNDFSAAYLIVLEYPWGNGKWDTESVHQIRVQLRLRTLGGSLPFTPYVRIKGVDATIASLPQPPYGNPSYTNPKIQNNTTDGVEVNLIDAPQTTDVVIEFKNLNRSNPKRVNGGAYYNTEPEYVMKYHELTEVDVYVKLSKEMKVSDLLDDKIDIFLASPDKTKEIHLRGFEPVFSTYDYNVSGLHKEIPYTTEKNLVWGIKIPKGKDFHHVAEKINFCDAYPDFAAWAISGGVSNEGWYNTNVEKQNLIEWSK